MKKGKIKAKRGGKTFKSAVLTLRKIGEDKVLIYGILFSGALVLVYLSFFSWLFLSWLSNPYINYGMIIPLISGYLIYRKSEKLKRDTNPAGLIIILFAVLLFFFNSMYIKALSFLMLLIGLIIYFFNIKFLNKIKFEILYLLLMIPLPQMVIEPLGLILQDTSLQSTFAFLSPFMELGLYQDYITVSGEPVLRYGLPCSGLESFLAFFVFSVLFAYLYEKKLWRAVVLVASSPFVAMLFNSLRLSLLISVAMLNSDIALGFFHLTSGPLLVVVYGILLILIYRRSI